MANVEINRQDVSEKSRYYSATKERPNKIMEKFNTIVVKTLNNKFYEPSIKKHEKEESNLDKRHNVKRTIMTLFLGLITALLLFHLGLPLLYAIINPLRTINSYNAEVEFMIDINNDTIEETRYQHILVDTPDIYIEQETYDRKIVPLKEENTAFNNAQVSKNLIIVFIIRKTTYYVIYICIYCVIILYAHI